jgi:hypothetical protein
MSNPILCLKSSHGVLIATEMNMLTDLPIALPGVSVNVNGTTMTQPQVLAQIQGHLDLLRQVEATRRHLQQLVAAEKAAHVQLKVTMTSVRHLAIGLLGPDSGQVAMLGFAVKPRTPPSSETAAAAVVKRIATRKARKTMGKRQRAAIHAPVSVAPAPAVPPPSDHARADGDDTR